MEEKDKSVIVIPDIHGRRFWEDGVKFRKPGELIIFLGDYTDPYPQEGIKHEVVPDILEEILKIPNTILLLGNHDFSYISLEAPKVRYDWDLERSVRVSEMFTKYHDRFKIGHVIERSCGNIIFTHAGLLEGKYHLWLGKTWTPSEVVEFYNKRWNSRGALLNIHELSWLRGGDSQCGSLIWADVREHFAEKDVPWSNDYQIFGHTMLIDEGRIIKTDTFCMLDNKRPSRVSWNDTGGIPEIEVL